MARSAEPISFKEASKKSGENYQTDRGRKYFEEFHNAIAKPFAEAMQASASKPDTVEPGELVFIVSAKGRVIRVMSSPGVPFAEAAAARLRKTLTGTVPLPPEDSWIVGMLVANHNNAEKNKPADRSVAVAGAQVDHMEKAMAPYIAKAQASYPAAKKKYLAGLPPKHEFLVWITLRQNVEGTKEARFEHTFISVDSIKEGIVSGKIANDLDRITNYRTGEYISFPESEVKNWVIVRPDGSEEGNEVGKFLDTYRPPAP